MVKYLLAVAAWVAGSYACYRLFGTTAILPYAGVTIVASTMAIVLANRKPRA